MSPVKPQVTMTPHLSSDRDNFYHHWPDWIIRHQFCTFSSSCSQRPCVIVKSYSTKVRICKDTIKYSSSVPNKHSKEKKVTFLRTAIAIVSYRIRRHFLLSSFHHWIYGYINPGHHISTHLYMVLLNSVADILGRQIHEPTTTRFISEC